MTGPLVFAHRGGPAGAADIDELPEHSLTAYRRAIEAGVDGLECDVRLTRDGHLVCIHDGRLDRTSNGSGRVSAATLDDLRRLDFGVDEVTGVLTLEQLLEVVVDSGRPLRLLIETKHPSRFGGAVESRLVGLLLRFGLGPPTASATVRVTVMSFSPLALRSVRGLAPGLPTAFLFDFGLRSALAGRPPFGADVLGPSVATLRQHPFLVRRAHEHGRQVYAWTANTDEEIDLAAGLGVDGIISDRPAHVLDRLGRH